MHRENVLTPAFAIPEFVGIPSNPYDFHCYPDESSAKRYCFTRQLEFRDEFRKRARARVNRTLNFWQRFFLTPPPILSEAEVIQLLIDIQLVPNQETGKTAIAYLLQQSIVVLKDTYSHPLYPSDWFACKIETWDMTREKKLSMRLSLDPAEAPFYFLEDESAINSL